jgi:Alternative complex III, ActD subunit
MKAIYALYDDTESAQGAVDGLRAAGFADRSIVIMSAEPFDEHEFGARDAKTVLPWIAAAGGALGLTFAFWLTNTVPRLWSIRTGGMPIVAPWPNIILMFELTMLGAIVATVLSLCVTAGLPARRQAIYDPEISHGHILIGIENPQDGRIDDLRKILSDGGRVKTVA